MIVLIPMGGKGLRFLEAGYSVNKACIPTTDRHTGQKKPMVICAMKDIPMIQDSSHTIVCVNRDFHAEDGTEDDIRSVFPQTVFIHDHVLLDQAYGCFLAREFLQSDEELFIGACDTGMDLDLRAFEMAKKEADVLMISHTCDTSIERDPNAHSWAKLKDNTRRIQSISLKQPVSDHPMNDHATTGMFWFKHANVFLNYLEKMIWNRDTLHGKYYVDKVLQYCIEAHLKVDYFDVKYIGWGTPFDYEQYEKTVAYWQGFVEKEGLESYG